MSLAVECLAFKHGVPPLEALEYYLKRLEARAGDEMAATRDVELWAKLWRSINGALRHTAIPTEGQP